MKRLSRLLIAALLFLPVLRALTQDNPQVALGLTGVNARQAPEIVITADVVDSAGTPVTGLTAADFTLSGDLAQRARIVRVENVASENLAFATVLVIDTSSSMAGKPVERAKEAAIQFINAIGSDDTVAIVTFDSRARVIQDFTTDKNVLLGAIDNMRFGGKTALYDAAVLGVETAQRAPLSRRVVIILSDGAEFGGLSNNTRTAAVEAAQKGGVSIFPIGLGFGTDRTFLQELASTTSARFNESPTPDELSAIYSDLARTFRSEYVITVALDAFTASQDGGLTLPFTLTAATSEGNASVDGSVRLPIPVPVIQLPEGLLDAPIAEPLEITPEVRADDDVASVEFVFGDTTTAAESLTIDPLDFAPGTYPLTIRATDGDGDVTTLEADVEIAALPSDVTVVGLPEAPIDAPVIVLTNATGQTPATTTTYTVDGTETDSADAANNFPFTLDPFNLAPGDYTLGVAVTNEGGVTTTVEQPFSVAAVPPSFGAISGISEGQEISEPIEISATGAGQGGSAITGTAVSVDGIPLDGLTLDPQNFQPGEREVEVTITDAAGGTASQTVNVIIAALPPVATLGELDGLTLTGDTDVALNVNSQTTVTGITAAYDDGEAGTIPGSVIRIPATELGTGDHTVTIVIENAGGQSTTLTADFAVLLPTPTPTPTLTPTVNTTGTAAAIATQTAVLTANAQGTANAAATANAQGTANADATVNAEANAEATANAQGTANAESTFEAVITRTAVLILTENAQSTLDAEQTAVAQSTAIAAANADAIGTATADAELTSQPIAATQTAEAEAELTAAAQGTQESGQVAAGSETAAAEESANATLTAEADSANATLTAEADDANSTATAQAAATLTAQPTATATEPPTLTPEPTIAEVTPTEAPPATQTGGVDTATIAILCGGVIVFLALLYYVISRSRSR